MTFFISILILKKWAYIYIYILIINNEKDLLFTTRLKNLKIPEIQKHIKIFNHINKKK